ncbi:hypothetical protein [Pseudoduganella albidiflava]|uniref:hypothetical protein n=1 Tax=Pseudoduganella albidiflava TaxID=321983 RepID=UPI0013F164FA|nr:hypothetical protein [Pseudoduganella albidiflava]
MRYHLSRAARPYGGVSNLFDTACALPAGGVYLAGFVNHRTGLLRPCLATAARSIPRHL